MLAKITIGYNTTGILEQKIRPLIQPSSLKETFKHSIIFLKGKICK